MNKVGKQTKPRVKRCFTLSEIFHRFIHSSELAYTNTTNNVFCKDNCMFVGKVFESFKKENISSIFSVIDYKCIAIIDRENKRIIINRRYNRYENYWKNAIPDNFEIFYTNNTIPSLDIFFDDELLYKTHAKYLVENLVNSTPLKEMYGVIYAGKKTIQHNIDCLDSYNNIKHIIEFVNKYNIKRYSFYNRCFNEIYRLQISSSNFATRPTVIKLPTLNQIVLGRIFKENEINLLRKKRFYTKYCFGNNIPFKDVVKYWNIHIQRNDMQKYLEKKGYDISEIKDYYYWNDYIIAIINNKKNKIKDEFEKNILKSNENIQKVKEEIIKEYNNNFSINDWRNYKKQPYIEKSCVVFIPNHKTNKGTWITKNLNNTNFGINVFRNIQLRLSKDKKYIQTSKGAIISLEDGIKCFKLFLKTIVSRYGVRCFSFDKTHKIGIYDLRFIGYREKKDNNGNFLGYNDWIIQIGCHSIWMTEVIDFIQYYHLEKDFGLECDSNGYNVYKTIKNERN